MLPRKVMVKLLLETQQLLQKLLVNLRTEMKRSRRNRQQALPVQQMDMKVPLDQIKQTSKGFVDGKNFWSKDGLGNTNKHEQGIMSLRFYGIEMVNVLAEFDNHWIQNQKKS